MINDELAGLKSTESSQASKYKYWQSFASDKLESICAAELLARSEEKKDTYNLACVALVGVRLPPRTGAFPGLLSLANVCLQRQ